MGTDDLSLLRAKKAERAIDAGRALCQHQAMLNRLTRVFLAVLVLAATSVSVGGGLATAFGGDGLSPGSCTGASTKKTRATFNDAGVQSGEIQLRWSASCYYGSAWTRTCAKSGYKAGYMENWRLVAPPSVGTALVYFATFSSQCSSSFTGIAGYSYSLFDNCAAAGLGTCYVESYGQIYRVSDNSLQGEGQTDPY